MGYAKADAPPTWYRLSEESWAEIRRDYQNGCTARELASRWRVSAGTIYRHACEEGWTKGRNGDAKARENARAVEAEQAADEAAGWPGTRGGMGIGALAALVPGPVMDGVERAHGLNEAALKAAAAAMRMGRLAEAQSLAKLAEMFDRMAARDRLGQLEAVYCAVCIPGWADRAMSLDGDPNPDPLKALYWRWKEDAGARAGAPEGDAGGVGA